MHDDIISQFRKDGYTVIEDFLSEAEIEDLIQSGKELTENLPEESKRKVFSTTDPEQNSDQFFLDSACKISHFFEADALDEKGKLKVDPSRALNKVGHALHWLNPTFKTHTFSDRVKEICFQLGMEGPVVVQSMYIYKNPGVGSEVVAHQDATFLHTDPILLVGFWIALDDATLDNGCLWFAPGSHRSGVHRRLIRNPDPKSKELVIFNAPPPFYPDSNFRPVPVKKGTCILIHGQVVHRSAVNKSQDPRHAYTFHVADLQKAKYSSQNWLQLPPGEKFPSLYEN